MFPTTSLPFGRGDTHSPASASRDTLVAESSLLVVVAVVAFHDSAALEAEIPFPQPLVMSLLGSPSPLLRRWPRA